MPIRITRQGNAYAALVTPPHGNGRQWHSERPLSADDLIEELRNLGCHTTDVSDAFYEADPLWLSRGKPDAEVGDA